MLPQPATETIKVEPSRLRLLIKGRKEGANRWGGGCRTLCESRWPGRSDSAASRGSRVRPSQENLHLAEAGLCGIVVKEISFEDWVWILGSSIY